MKNKTVKLQKNNYGRGYLSVNPDMSGHLIVTEDSSDGEAVRMGTWRLDHLVHLAKLYDQEKFGEKYDKRITELEAKIIDMQRDIHSLIAGNSRIPRFGWRQK